MHNRRNKVIKSTFFGVANNFFSMFGQMAVRTLLIWKLGNEYAGLNTLFTSILSILSLSELGVGSAMCYSMYRPIAEGNQNAINALVNLYRKLCRTIGSAILILGLLLLPFLDEFIKGDIPDDINIYLLYLIFLFNTAISYFLFSYQIAVLDAYQRNDLQSKIMLIIKFIMYTVQSLIIIIWHNYWLYIMVLPVLTIMENLLRAIVVRRKFPEIHCTGEVEKKEKESIKKEIIALFGHRLNGTIINSADSVVISAYLGLNIVAIYGNYYYILTAVALPFASFFSAIRPSIGNCYVKEDTETSYDLFLNVVFGVKWIAAWFSICLLCLYQSFIKFWVGPNNLLEISTVILFSILFYEWRIFDCLTIFKDAAGLWWEDRIRPYIACVFNLVVNITLVNLWGINGVILSTIMAHMLISTPWVARVLLKRVFHRRLHDFYIGYVRDFIIFCLIGTLTFAVCSLLIDTLLGFLIKMSVCIILPNICLGIIYRNCSELHYWRDLVREIFRKLKLNMS